MNHKDLLCFVIETVANKIAEEKLHLITTLEYTITAISKDNPKYSEAIDKVMEHINYHRKRIELAKERDAESFQEFVYMDIPEQD